MLSIIFRNLCNVLVFTVDSCGSRAILSTESAVFISLSFIESLALMLMLILVQIQDKISAPTPCHEMVDRFSEPNPSAIAEPFCYCRVFGIFLQMTELSSSGILRYTGISKANNESAQPPLVLLCC